MQSPTSDAIAAEFGATEEVIVRAGAGAGKTTELVLRVLGIAKRFKTETGRFPKLVVTTFTRKATQELRERIVKKALRLGDQDLIEYVQRPSDLHISTIHGVLSIFLSKYANQMGLRPQFNLVPSAEEQRVVKKILRNLLTESAADVELILEHCSLSQLIASLQNYFRLQITDMVEPVSKSILSAELENFDREWCAKAAELSSYLDRNENSEKWQEYRKLLDATIASLQANKSPRRSVYEKFILEKPKARLKSGTDESVTDLRDFVQDSAVAVLENFNQTEESLETHEILISAFDRIAKMASQILLEKKIQSNNLTMSDLEGFSLHLARKFPKSAAAFSEEWDYWLLDEYQDTSPLQVELLKLLIGNRKGFTVGDPQQSIYLFRGARTEVFISKEQEVLGRSGRSLAKMTNYRSQRKLLEFFNHFFAKLGPNFRPMQASEVDKNAFNYQGPVARLITVAEAEASDAQFRAALQICRDLLITGCPAEEICVLSRTNADLEKLAKLAQECGIPVQVHSAAKFFQRREIIDALALLKFLVNPYDNRNLILVLRSPWFKLEDSKIAKFCGRFGDAFWIQFLKSEDPQIQKLNELLSLSKTRGISSAWEKALIDSGMLGSANLMDATGRREANLWKLIGQLRAQERHPGFRYLEFAERSENALVNIDEGGDGDAVTAIEAKRVNLMTVHAAKGLQFEHVILPSMGQFRLQGKADFFLFDEHSRRYSLCLVEPESAIMRPSLWGSRRILEHREREREEYDRVLYVALTRAKSSVTLVSQKAVKGSWADRMWKPNRDEQSIFAVAMEIDFSPSLIPTRLENRRAREEVQPLKLRTQSAKSMTSVSDLLKNQKLETATTVGNVDTVAKVNRALAGVDAHRLFESIKYRGIKTEGPGLRFLREWNQGQILRWIEQGEVEWGFSINFADQWIQGQIDLWCRDQDDVLWVVDYKTGSESHVETAFQQLQLYAWALRKIKQSAELKTNLVVIYPISEKVFVRPADQQLLLEAFAKKLVDSRKELL